MDDFSMSRRPIVILGAGIGGLTLGRCLQHHRISFTIYERASSKPRHNYGINISQRVFRPLLDVLQSSDHSFRDALTVTKAYQKPTSVGGRTAENQIHTPASVPAQSSSSDFQANRSAFESLLAKPIEQHIKYSSCVKSVKPASAAGAEAEVIFETDSASSDLIIDCTGIHSPLRASLLPDRTPKIHPYVAINGKRYLQPEKWEEVYERAFGEKTALHTIVQFEHKSEGVSRSITARLEVAINEMVLDGEKRLERVSISYTYSRKAFQGEDPLYTPDRSKEAATEIPSQFSEELSSLVKSGKLSAMYTEVFDPAGAGNDRRLSWLLRSIYLDNADLKSIRDQCVLTIGDAGYAEPIVGSVPGGANHVIGQAMRLADQLATEWKGNKKIPDMDLQDYLEPKPRSRQEDVAAHLEQIHELEPAKAAL